jgi:cytochrome-b5 reductase
VHEYKFRADFNNRYQIIRAIAEDPNDETEMNLVYANRSPDDILMREQLDRFARMSKGRFRVWYLVDKAPTGWKYGVGFVNKQVIEEHLPAPSEDTKMLLCGPPGKCNIFAKTQNVSKRSTDPFAILCVGLVNASKKSLVELGFAAPGALSRISDQVFCF